MCFSNNIILLHIFIYIVVSQVSDKFLQNNLSTYKPQSGPLENQEIQKASARHNPDSGRDQKCDTPGILLFWGP